MVKFARIRLMEKIKAQLKDIIKKLYKIDIEVSLADVPEGMLGDYSTNVAMRLAKEVGKGPREIAEEIVAAFGDGDVELEIAGPGFVNITVLAKSLMRDLERDWSDKYGSNDDGAGKVAIVEYPSPNMAKPYSVGHLRPGNQGWAVKRLLEETGWRVITDNHLGDSGTPFGIWAVGFEGLQTWEKENLNVYVLGKMYIEMKARLKKEEEAGKSELKDAVQWWLLKLEAGDAKATALSEKFNAISLRHIHEVMGRLKISTDYEFGERYFVNKSKELVQKYIEMGVFERNNDGSAICRLDEFGIDVPLLMQKSNGAALYATTDLACMVQRAEEFEPDMVVHCVGVEQKFYFEQLFAMAKKISEADKSEVGRNLGKIDFEHVWFGTIDQKTDGKREKISSRKGVILMEELLDKAEATAREITEGRDVSSEDISRIALGAIKFTDFAADKKTGILFDWEKIFALSGFSGPSCQYATVRVNKIIELNRDFEVVDYSEYDFEAEKGLLKELLAWPEVVKSAAVNLEGHRIAGYVYRLAREFNRYYENVQVSKAEAMERSARLDLMKKVSQVMTFGLDLLGIEIPNRM